MAAFSFSLVQPISNPVEGGESPFEVCGGVFFIGITLECNVSVEVMVIGTDEAGMKD